MYLGGARPTVMLQSSGLGNSANALTSLLIPYQIPMLVIVSMRGDAGEWNAAQVPMGRAVAPICDAIGLSVIAAETAEACAATVHLVGKTAFGTRLPGVCQLPRRITVPVAAPRCADDQPRSDRGRGEGRGRRADRCEPWLSGVRPLCGRRPSGELLHLGQHGLASSIGLGLAVVKPNAVVFVIDGDGSLLMNLGSLATIGWQQPANLVVVVLDNAIYATTGGQDTATAHGTNLEGPRARRASQRQRR